MITKTKIDLLESQLAEARRLGLNAIDRAEKWREALTTISNQAESILIRNIAKQALLDI